jgi:hypothetical protein
LILCRFAPYLPDTIKGAQSIIKLLSLYADVDPYLPDTIKGAQSIIKLLSLYADVDPYLPETSKQAQSVITPGKFGPLDPFLPDSRKENRVLAHRCDSWQAKKPRVLPRAVVDPCLPSIVITPL